MEGRRRLAGSSLEALTRGLTDRDRLGRGYDEAYLRLLACEVGRVEEACAGAARRAPQPEVPAEDPAPSRELVAKLASIYTDCFEEEPTAEADGRFAALLAVLSEEMDLVIGHDPAFLAEVIRP